MVNKNLKLSTELTTAIDAVRDNLLLIEREWQDTLNVNYPFGFELAEVIACISHWGLDYDYEFTGDQPLTTTVENLLTTLKDGSRVVVYSSAKYNYSAKDVADRLIPFLQLAEYDFDYNVVIDGSYMTLEVHEAGRPYDKVFGGGNGDYDSLITVVGKILVEFQADSRYLICSSIEHDYTAEDILSYVTPLMNDQKCSFSVDYIQEKSTAVLSIY